MGSHMFQEVITPFMKEKHQCTKKLTHTFSCQVNRVGDTYEGWVLGWMDKEEFIAKAKRVKQGEPTSMGSPRRLTHTRCR